ncbi:hypothetical protein IE077_000719, partial [Cardiosporidium cionae]
FFIDSITVTAQFAKKYDFQCNSNQACLLLLFNEHSHLTLEEIERHLGVSSEYAKNLIASLIFGKYRILLLAEETSFDDFSATSSSRIPNTILSTDVFKVNPHFNASNRRIRLGMPVREEIACKARIEEDRTFAIEAALVRIMKARKVIQHDKLISAVQKQLSPYFKPNPRLIKLRIEHLLEREYIERESKSRNMYRYSG